VAAADVVVAGVVVVVAKGNKINVDPTGRSDCLVVRRINLTVKRRP
jgi:hypothetical protein